MHVIIPHIDEALGYSVVIEEYKGDFAKARQCAENVVADARRRNDLTALADALLASGVVHLLQCEPSQALACFQELEQVAPEDAAHQLHAIHYSWLAECLQFNTFPDGGGAAAEEIGARWNGKARLSSWIARKQALTGQLHHPLLRLEAQLVFGLLPQLQSTRSIVQTSRFTASAVSSEFMLNIALPVPAGFRQDAERVGADASILAYADLAAADLYRRAGNTDIGGVYMEQALRTYRTAGDQAGMAACHMMQDDWCAAPFSTPAVWNFALQESSSEGSALAWTLEASDFDLDGLKLDCARTAYAKAENGFREAEAPRGVAYVHLHYGYLVMLDGNDEAAVAWTARAQNGFDACGDGLGYWLVQGHRLLARIGAGLLPEDREMARAIGAWGAAEGSFSYTMRLGLLFGRAGRHWLTRKADYERALACFRLAQALFQGLQTPLNVGHILVDQGIVFEALGESSAVLTRFEKALDVYLESLFERAAIAEGALRYALMLVWDIYNLYLDGRDVEGLERITARLEALIARSREERASGEAGEEAEAGLTTFALDSMAHSVLGQARVFAPLYRAVQARDNGDKVAAEQGFRAALNAVQRASPGERDYLEAVICAHQKRYSEAKEAFRKYLEQGGADAGFIGPLIMVLKAAGGKQAQREGHIQSVRTNEQAFGFMVRIKAYEEARAYVQQLEHLAPDWWRGDKKPWQSHSDYGEMREGLAELTEAQDCYDRAIGELEVRRDRLSRDELKRALAAGLGAQYLYFQAAQTALKLHDQVQQRGDRAQAEAHAAAAFAYAERNKTRALLDLMAAGAASMGAARAESQPMRLWHQHNARLSLWRGLLARERRQQTPDDARITHLEQQLETEDADLHRVEAKLAQEDPYFFQAVNVQADVMALADVSDALPADTALLQYYVLGEDLLAWAVTDRGMVEVHRAPVDARALARQARAFHKAA